MKEATWKELQKQIAPLCAMIDERLEDVSLEAMLAASAENPMRGIMAYVTVQGDYIARMIFSYEEAMKRLDGPEARIIKATDLSVNFGKLIADMIPKFVELHRAKAQ